MIPKEENERIQRKFRLIRTRQLLALVVAFCAMVVLALWSEQHPWFFRGSWNVSVSAIQILIIVGFINFSAWNWRCPSCKNYLGHDFTRRSCKKCGTRLN